MKITEYSRECRDLRRHAKCKKPNCQCVCHPSDHQRNVLAMDQWEMDIALDYLRTKAAQQERSLDAAVEARGRGFAYEAIMQAVYRQIDQETQVDAD
jgi:hypothetical protein